MTILYQDESIVVAVKEAGVLSEGSGMPRMLSEAIGGQIFPVHRLDRETAGVMVFARTSDAAAALSETIRNGGLEKEYYALIHTRPESDHGEMEDLLFYDRQKNKVFPVRRERKGVKRALLSYFLLRERDGVFLVLVRPLTGRTHQIRVQFASRKMPLVGDRKYGGKGEGLALFCHSLRFPHPKNKAPLSFSFDPSGGAWGAFFEV